MVRLSARRSAAFAAAVVPVILAGACGGSPSNGFSSAAARSHVNVLAGTIGIRPIGTDANRRAREYIVEQLERSGFRAHIQATDAVRPEFGQTARVSNIVGILPGPSAEAVAVVAHYDSTPDGPGAADDALGVAVCLEAGRVLAARPARRHTLVVAITDAEEIGLMGAAALIEDPAWQQVRAYLNFEAVGTSGQSALFETGPGNTWLVEAWAEHARQPFGGSFAREIYKRLNNDTDFTVLKRSGAPGLNFASISNSYAYHTQLDTPARLADDTIALTGGNAVAIVEALDQEDIARRSADATLFFDVGGLGAVAAGSVAFSVLAVLALAAVVVAWLRMFAAGRRAVGVGRMAITACWAVVALAATLGLMVAAAWSLRAAREVYHPWYAHPDRFFAMLTAAGACGWWGVGRIAELFPARFRPERHPAIAWSGLLLVWAAFAVAAVRFAPAASYLATVPLLAAGAALAVVSTHRATAIRAASLVPLVTAWLIWSRLAAGLAHFLVPMFGRLPVVTPVLTYPLVLFVAGLFVAAPVLPTLAGARARRLPPPVVAAIAFLALVATFWWAHAAPAYSAERPMYRAAQYIQDLTTNAAFWELGGNEPGVDLNALGPAPHDWARVTDAAPVSVPADRPGGPFRFRAPGDPGLAPPAEVEAAVEPSVSEVSLAVTVRPTVTGAVVALFLPPGVTPRDANVPGVMRGRRWRAAYVAPPPEGFTFHVTLRPEDQAALADARVAVQTRGLPGGTGPLALPAWLPQDRVAWRARTVSILAVPLTKR